MQNLKMFSLCLYPRHHSIIKQFKYIPVGLAIMNLMIIGLKIIQEIIFQRKIHIMENTLFIIGYGKII